MSQTFTRTIRRAWLALVAAAAATLLASSPAAAHDNLLDSSPAAGETVTALDAVTLTFSGELIDFEQTSYAQVQGPDGLYYETSCSTIDLNILTTPVALGEAGTYTIVWNAVSSDGHPISESYDFQYAPPADAEPALGWDQPACRNEETRVQPGAEPTPDPTATADDEAATPDPEPTASDAATPAPDAAGEGAVVLAVAGGVFLVAALGAIAVWAVRARARRKH
ncbi:copper resistance CopC family protein [Microbacterium sp. NPDC096154]|uniref:copper resistance CopC family protein n=1 Tax=Microbacterium sp. NPDC096154 TaxID=3155549 RepID=UPI00332B8BCF